MDVISARQTEPATRIKERMEQTVRRIVWDVPDVLEVIAIMCAMH